MDKGSYFVFLIHHGRRKKIIQILFTFNIAAPEKQGQNFNENAYIAA